MAKKREEPPKAAPTMLMGDVESARAALVERKRLGQELLSVKVTHGGEMEAARREFQKWHDYNVTLLERLFTADEFARSYEWSGQTGSISFNLGGGPPVIDFNEDLQGMQGQVQYLDSLIERLPLLQSSQHTGARPTPRGVHALAPTAAPSRVFIVHGQDGAARASVARFLEKAGIEAVILHEQASRGDTIIEKLERNADVHFAVVLLTGDDEGRRKGDAAPPKPRARQNVILELGYFVAKLRRENVCVLYEDGVELPSDWNGVVWVALDGHEAWKYKLAKELNAAGFSIDLNRV
jgi:predicted nucleotide-binding protein